MKWIIPKLTRLFGIEHKTKLVKNLARDSGNSGLYVNEAKEIWLSKDLAWQAQFHTYIHEVTEGSVVNLEIEMAHADITRLGTAFTQFLLDNIDRMVE